MIYPIAQDLATISGFKIAFLMVAGMTLVRTLITRNSSSTTLKKLAEIRRDIVFDRISTDTAKKLSEIAIYGLNKSAVVQAEVTNRISTLQMIDAELNNAQKKIDAGKLLISETDAEFPKDKLILWEAIRDSAYSHFRLARKAYLSDVALHRGSRVYVAKYGMFEPSDTNYLAHLEKLSNFYSQVKEKYDSTIWEWLQYISKFEGKDSALAWLDVAVQELGADLLDKGFG